MFAQSTARIANQTKTPNAEPASAPAPQKPANSLRQSSEDLLALVVRTFTGHRGAFEAEVAASAVAAVAGEYALRAAGAGDEKDHADTSRLAHGMLFHGDGDDDVTAWWMIARAAKSAGLNAADLPNPDAVRDRIAAGLCSPEENAADAQQGLAYGISRLRIGVHAWSYRHGLSETEVATMLGWAIGMVIAKTRSSVAPSQLAAISLRSMIRACRAQPFSRPGLSVVRS